jgi:HSP20 family protein
MTLMRPMRGLWELNREFERMFNELAGSLFGARSLLSSGRGTAEDVWVPALEMYARGADLVIRADLPGVKIDDVDITLEGETLTISGVRKGTPEEVSYYVREVPYGAFRRSIAVPEDVEAENIKAHLEDGVLEVVLPGVVREAQPKRIAIEGATAEQTRS